MRARAERWHRLRQSGRYYGSQALGAVAEFFERWADRLAQAYVDHGTPRPAPRPAVIQVHAVGTYVRAETDGEAADLFLWSL